MKPIITALAAPAALVALAAPGAASAHTLSMKEARRAINQVVQGKADYGYEPGSMVLYCGRRTLHHIHCDLLFTDLDGDPWCGGAHARYVTRTSYVINAGFNVSMRGCQYF
jgi:hypothetical protein